ncbi:hypothetical protein [Sorangium cellulosum]|uniref:hypothetical protein n=1 Tax=Sorangium cellulosum TaxID=56 RepID=UPI0011DCC638|nr:hypothetical protein [Sorangium cellulosum]
MRHPSSSRTPAGVARSTTGSAPARPSRPVHAAIGESSGASSGLALSACTRSMARATSGLPAAMGCANAAESARRNGAMRAASRTSRRTRKALRSMRASTSKPAATSRASTTLASAVVATEPRSVATEATSAGAGSPSRETSVSRGRASRLRTSMRPTLPSGVETSACPGAVGPPGAAPLQAAIRTSGSGSAGVSERMRRRPAGGRLPAGSRPGIAGRS